MFIHVHISRGSNEYVVPIGTFIGELDGGGISYLRRFSVNIILLILVLVLLFLILVLFILIILLHSPDHHWLQGGGGDGTSLRVGSNAFKNYSCARRKPRPGILDIMINLYRRG